MHADESSPRTREAGGTPLGPLAAVQIRRFREEDAAACLELYEANERSGFVPTGYQEEFRGQFTKPGVGILCAVRDGRVLACACLRRLRQPPRSAHAWSGSLTYLLVHPAAQRQGLGQWLLEAVLLLVPETEPLPWHFHLNATDQSWSYYLRHGFVVAFEYRDARGHPTYSMGKNIDQEAFAAEREHLRESRVELEVGAALEAVTPNEPLGYTVSVRSRWVDTQLGVVRLSDGPELCVQRTSEGLLIGLNSMLLASTRSHCRKRYERGRFFNASGQLTGTWRTLPGDPGTPPSLRFHLRWFGRLFLHPPGADRQARIVDVSGLSHGTLSRQSDGTVQATLNPNLTLIVAPLMLVLAESFLRRHWR